VIQDFQLNLNNKELEHLLQLVINVLRRKTELKQVTGLVILADIGNHLEEVLTSQDTGSL